jgi:hypothetical protein
MCDNTDARKKENFDEPEFEVKRVQLGNLVCVVE